MRLHPEPALVVYLCLWIPVAQSYGALAPEDQDGSGDEEFSGSGSGDGNDNWFFEPDVTTQASLNTTERVWFTDAPISLPEHPATQFVNPDTESETSGHITEAPLSYTTQITETQPSLVIKSVGSEEDQKAETTTISDVAQPETTVPPDEELPVVPVHEEGYTTIAHDEENVTESSVIHHEEAESTVLVKTVTVPSEAPNMETTTLLLSTSAASNLADAEASGGDVESTTVKVIEDSIEPKIISVVHQPNLNKDFDFGENQNPDSAVDQSGSRSGFVSNSDSLLERKEVLAGVIAGGVVGLAFAVLLVALMVYRMKKKDEGSYSLDEQKHPNGGYQKPQKQEEFLA